MSQPKRHRKGRLPLREYYAFVRQNVKSKQWKRSTFSYTCLVSACNRLKKDGADQEMGFTCKLRDFRFHLI